MLLVKEIIGRSESRLQVELHDGSTPVLNRKYIYGTREHAEGLVVLAPSWYIAKVLKLPLHTPEPAEAPPLIDTLVCAPPPMRYRTEPWSHQAAAYHRSAGLKANCLNMAMGTGKSKVALDLAASRYAAGQIQKLVVVAPVNLKENWRKQVELHDAHQCEAGRNLMLFDDRTDEDERETLRWLHEPGYGIALCGLESLSTDKYGGRAYRAALKLVRNRKCMLVVDECHKIKGGHANRTINVKSLAQWTPFKNIMTGTNIVHNLGDLFHPYGALDPKIIGYQREVDFWNKHIITEPIPHSSRKRVVMYVNIEQIAARIAPYTVQCTKEQALDLPPKVEKTCTAYLTERQWESYRAAKDEILALCDKDGDFNEYKILRLFTVLQQIVSGYTVDIKREWAGPKYVTVPVPSGGALRRLNPDPAANVYTEERIVTELCAGRENPKVAAMLDIIEASSDEQFVIWCKYRKEIEDVVAAVVADYGADQVCQLHGGIKQKDRDTEKARFMSGARFFVSLPQAGGEGLNGLECSHNAIYYSNSFKYGERVQSEDRQHRPGQQNKVTYTDIWTDTGIDRIIQQCLAKKESLDEWVKRALAESTREILEQL